MKRAKAFYLSFIVACLAIIAGCIYYLMGGFDPVEIYFFEGNTRTVIGREYVLRDDNKYFQREMDSIYADIQAGTLKGMLTAVIYQDEHLKDSTRYFLGASQDGSKGVARVPAGFDYRQFSTDRIYKIFITQSGWVSPTPKEIEEIMQVKSIEEGEILKPYTFELYYKDGSFSVEKWVK